VTIDNAGKLNSMSRAVGSALVAAIEKLSQDERLRVVILRGAGERAFIGGADVRDLAGLDASNAAAFITGVHKACDCLRRCPVPVIARIQGYALGAGLEAAAACDMRVASDDSVFGMPEVKLGLPSVVEAALLPQLIGWGRTRQLVLTGENISAAKAEAWGLVEEVVPASELDEAVERLAASIVEAGPHAVRLQKRLVSGWEERTASQGVQLGIAIFAETFATDEPTRMIGAALERMRSRKR
jgi:enoyl-CoA hydratase/carnithine racemase